MSLRPRERRRLSGIQGTLGRCDPGLVSLFAIFSRLAQGEEMPAAERLRVRVDRLAARGRGLPRLALSRLRIIVIAPVALGAAAAALLLGGWSGNPGTCKAMAAAHSALRGAPVPPRLSFCPPVMPWRPAIAGR
jgi:hypothetical protein